MVQGIACCTIRYLNDAGNCRHHSDIPTQSLRRHITLLGGRWLKETDHQLENDSTDQLTVVMAVGQTGGQ